MTFSYMTYKLLFFDFIEFFHRSYGIRISKNARSMRGLTLRAETD